MFVSMGLLLGCFRFKKSPDKLIASCNKLFFVAGIFLLLSNFFYFGNYYPNYSGEYTFDFLYATNNGSSGWAAFYYFVSLSLLIQSRTILRLISFLISVLLLMYIFSRGTILAVMASTFLLFFKRERVQRPYVLKVIFILSLLFSLSIGFFGYVKNGSGSISYNNLAVDNIRSYNTSLRLDYLFPHAIDGFLTSPVFGNGFGTFNDNLEIETRSNYSLGGVRYDDAHAHNSYLHLLYETGFLGIFFIYVIFHYLANEISSGVSSVCVKDILFTYLSAIFLSSITEHRLFTPSMMFPFALLFIYSYKNDNSQ